MEGSTVAGGTGGAFARSAATGNSPTLWSPAGANGRNVDDVSPAGFGGRPAQDGVPELNLPEACMDAEDFDRLVAQFDTAMGERRETKLREVDELRHRVAELEAAIAATNDTTRAAGRSVSTSEQQIATLVGRNDTLQRRVVELEAQVAAAKRRLADDGVSGAGGVNAMGASAGDAIDPRTAAQLRAELEAARAEVRRQKKEIVTLRGLLTSHMASPYRGAAPMSPIAMK
jgi:hypothetical protein